MAEVHRRFLEIVGNPTYIVTEKSTTMQLDVHGFFV